MICSSICYIITEGYIIFIFIFIFILDFFATPSNNTYKGLIMAIFYLIQNTSGAKGALSARKPRIRENQKFASRTLPRLRGVCWKLGSFYPKNIGSRQAPGSVRNIDRLSTNHISIDFPIKPRYSICVWFPTCQVRVSGVYHRLSHLFSSSPPRLQPRAPELSGHCRTSTASSRSQWALCTERMSE